MKIYVAVDMEGISGIIDTEQIIPGRSCYHEGRQYVTEEVNACVSGCIDAGATEIIVADKHYQGRNFIWHELDDRASYIIGKSENSPHGRMPGIDSCDGLILLGYHAMAGVHGAVLEHTWSSETWQNLWINDRPGGEIALEMGFAAEFGVPAIMVSGDDKACMEAASLVPDIVQAQVKQGISLHGAKLLSRGDAHALIRQQTAAAVRKCKEIAPAKFKLPVTMRLECVERSVSLSDVDKPYMKVLDARTFEVTGDLFTQAFYRLIKNAP